MDQCDICATFRVVGFSWDQMADGSWKRFMLRECIKCKVRAPTKLYWVNPDTPICTYCLSQDFILLTDSDETVLKCTKCDENAYVIQLELDPPSGSEE